VGRKWAYSEGMAHPTLKELSPAITELSQRAQYVRGYSGTHGRLYSARELDELDSLDRAARHCELLAAHALEVRNMILARRASLYQERSRKGVA